MALDGSIIFARALRGRSLSEFIVLLRFVTQVTERCTLPGSFRSIGPAFWQGAVRPLTPLPHLDLDSIHSELRSTERLLILGRQFSARLNMFELPDTGLYRTTVPYPGHEDLFPAGVLVYVGQSTNGSGSFACGPVQIDVTVGFGESPRQFCAHHLRPDRYANCRQKASILCQSQWNWMAEAVG